MTQEQLNQIEAWRESLDAKQNDEQIVNAMWLAEEMWESHCSIMNFGNEYIDFDTYMIALCMALMEYIWMPHDIIKSITEDLDDVDTLPEEFICDYRPLLANYVVRMSYIATNDETDHDYEKRSTLKICDTKTEAEALTAILNHANKAGHHAVTRLSA